MSDTHTKSPQSRHRFSDPGHDPATAAYASRVPTEPLQPVTITRAVSGMVCAIDHLAAQAGLTMLIAGGSAADAAVATSAVLAVTAQHMCGMGGDLLAVVAAPGADPVALDSAGFAGAGADPDRLRREGYAVMPFRDDIRAVTVPGCVDGWLALHTRYGRLPLAEVLAPARRYAHDGFPASPTLVAAIAGVAHLAGAADFTGVGPPIAGRLVRRPGIARALDAVAGEGRGGFYGGEFGEGLVTLGGGHFAASDLSTPVARWLPALAAPAWGRRLWTVPPASQGYLTLAGAGIADGLELPQDPDDPQWAHLLIESARQAAWDRMTVLHDGAVGADLIDPGRLSARRGLISSERAAALGDRYREGGTIALCAVDADRMGVSVLQSNAAGFGSHLVEPGTGIFLQNRGIGFSLKPGHPGEYRPGRRPAHTLSPLAVTGAGGGLAAVAGTMGGDSQPQILLQILARTLQVGEDPGVAVAAGRWALGATAPGSGFDTWHDQGNVRVMIEGHAPSGWDDGLRRLGHQVGRAEPFSSDFGHAHYIGVEKDHLPRGSDHLVGGSDPRARAGAAVGW